MAPFSEDSSFNDIASAQAQSAAATAARAAREAQTRLDGMQRDIHRLLLVTEALWTLLKQRHGYSDEDLLQALNYVDMQDGALDGRPAKLAPRPCPQCGRNVAAHDAICMYCGRAMQPMPFGR